MRKLPVLTITWHTHPSEINVCPFCHRLNGHQWVFYRKDVTSARLPPFLAYPGLGVVWSFRDNLPRTHGTGSRGHWNCRCHLTYTFNFDDIGDGAVLPDFSQRIATILDRVETIADQIGV